MAENKKQHYVPKFYLSLFSCANLGTHIGLFQKEKDRFISQANLKGQAYEDYFYGKDLELEKILSKIEDRAKNVIEDIVKTQIVPNPNTHAYNILFVFVFLQAVRTKSAAEELNSVVNTTFKKFASYDQRFQNIDEDLVFRLSEPAAYNLSILSQTIHSAYDLSCKLIVNQSNNPFITSDHPVIRYNQFFEKRNYPYAGGGLASKGLQVFYPLTPNLMILFYDKKVYKIGHKKKNTVETNNQYDIDSLNKIQFVNTADLIYFNHLVDERYIRRLYQSSLRFERGAKSKINEYDGADNPDGTKSVLLHYQKHDIRTNLDLSFIKLTVHAKSYVFSDFIVHPRDPDFKDKVYPDIDKILNGLC